MTRLRQAFYAGLVLASLGVSASANAQQPAPIGPPTAADAAAAVAAAPVAPVVAPTPAAPVAKPAPWLAKRPAPKPAATGTSAMPSTGRLLGVLLVMASLGGAVLYLKRRGRGDAKRAAVPQQRLTVLSSTRIGPKAHAVVISVAGRQMLLGVTDASVKRLAFIDEIEEEERERDRDPLLGREPARRQASHAATRGAAIAVHNVTPTAAAPKAGSFADMLKTAFGKRAPEPAVDAASILAAETQDSVGGKPVAGNANAAGTGSVRMLDVEGQAQGLIRRLSGPRA